jgi:hypothetical protein
MGICMRTTLDLDDDLLKEAKVVARAKGITLTSLLEDALRERLARSATAPPGDDEWVRVPTSGSGGLQPGIDLDDSRALLDLLDGAA